jgi:cyclophilin family peptidyl-prolyl cis-trans isomerase
MRRALPLALALSLLASWAADRAEAENSFVRVTSVFGAFDIELCSETSARCHGAAPLTVANFLAYVDRGAFANSIVHRSIAMPTYPYDFVMQTGGFFLDKNAMLIRTIPEDPPIANEFNQSNLWGSVAMAKGATPDSATDQWFINLDDNSGPCPGTPQQMGLDCQNGGFTVFGQVVAPGMRVVDAIAVTQAYNIYGDTFFDPAFESPCPNPPQCMESNFDSTPLGPNYDPMAVVNPTDFLPYLVLFDVQRVPEPDVAALLLVAGGTLATLRRRAYPARR